MTWFTNFIKKKIIGVGSSSDATSWISCKQCKNVSDIEEIKKNLYVCKNCNFHDSMPIQDRITMLFDEHKFIPVANIKEDPLNFSDLTSYQDKLKKARENSVEASILLKGRLNNAEAIFFIMDFKFIGGSMGVHVGNTFIKGIYSAIENKCPYITLISSGGARMQEGILALMQMPRTVAAVKILEKHKLPLINVLLHPTTGGVAASFASLGAITIAESGSLIGFSGRRVIENTMKVKLPNDFQTAEFQLDKGMIDQVVSRKDLKSTLSKLIKILT